MWKLVVRGARVMPFGEISQFATITEAKSIPLPVGTGNVHAVVQLHQGDNFKRAPVADDEVGNLPVEPCTHRPAGALGLAAVIGDERGKGHLRKHGITGQGASQAAKKHSFIRCKQGFAADARKP